MPLMDKEQIEKIKKDLEKILLAGYITLTFIFTGHTLNAIDAASKGYGTVYDIIFNGAVLAFTTTGAIHYYKLINNQKGK